MCPHNRNGAERTITSSTAIRLKSQASRRPLSKSSAASKIVCSAAKRGENLAGSVIGQMAVYRRLFRPIFASGTSAFGDRRPCDRVARPDAAARVGSPLIERARATDRINLELWTRDVTQCVIADRSSGVVRRVGVSLRPAIAITLGILSVPVLMGLGAKWSASTEIDQLKSANSLLEVENGSYRQATGELTGQIQSLENVIDDLGARATLAPEQARAMQKLPAVVKSRAVGGVTEPNRAIADVVSSLSSPEDTFGVLRDLLSGLESRLNYVRRTSSGAKRWRPRRRRSGRRTAG